MIGTVNFRINVNKRDAYIMLFRGIFMAGPVRYMTFTDIESNFQELVTEWQSKIHGDAKCEFDTMGSKDRAKYTKGRIFISATFEPKTTVFNRMVSVGGGAFRDDPTGRVELSSKATNTEILAALIKLSSPDIED